ncbi:glycosyltransferase family 4 protein [Methanosarcina sp. UBA411]|jgi:glycosyltransferase involved in cell wall biosynthesis|uniref:glycosyltransferase family 4 protein n=1 Tax=Methanosarcina sp. UBA411 TaxID=1915589 RepID=UPI0025E03F72|nr:glycosyltransferase family 4 protein [Methanosarcina sp. UBA411]
MHVLHILPYVPKPVSGSSVRDYNLIKYFSELGVTSQVVCSLDCDLSTEEISSLEKELGSKIYATKSPNLTNFKRASVLLSHQMYPRIYRYHTSKNVKFISSVLQKGNFDIVNVSNLVVAGPALQAISDVSFEGCKVLSMHDVDYLSFINRIKLFNNPLERIARKLISGNLKTYEINTISKFEHLLVTSKIDKNIYLSLGVLSDNKITVIPNGVDCGSFNLNDNFDTFLEHPNILFMGSLSYQPNIDAVQVYIEEMHSIVKNEIPNVKFYIIGGHCPEWIKDYSKKDPSICVLGFVDDVKPYIYSADVCIAPINAGSGTRLKILEYMAMSKPVVSTTIGSEGLDVINSQNILITDDWNEFAFNIVNLITNYNIARKIGNSGRELVEEKYDWKKIAKKQVSIYEKLLRETHEKY